ncbi:MAG TPA: ferredoxin family protein [Anaerolineae bacterium]|nr:ferredoxin family protein [Anaerolineae bacterium]HIQ05275.1 ferredoxin family protein [Anaerolineae bacterium]
MNAWEFLRTELGRVSILRNAQIHFDVEKCVGVYECYEVCPVGCWTPDRPRRKVVFHDGDRCIACGACVLQCPEHAIELR